VIILYKRSMVLAKTQAPGMQWSVNASLALEANVSTSPKILGWSGGVSNYWHIGRNIQQSCSPKSHNECWGEGLTNSPKATVACISCQAAPRRTTCGGEVIEVWMMRRHAASVLQSLIHEGRGCCSSRCSKSRERERETERERERDWERGSYGREA